MTLLRDLLVRTKDGEWGDGEPSDETVEMRVVRGTDFEHFRLGTIDNLPVRHIKKGHAERKTLQANDIIIETAGGSKDRPTGRTVFVNAARIAQADRPLVPASFARFLRVDSSKIDPPFLFWKLQSMYEDGTLRKYHTQHTGVARFQYTTFATSEDIKLPSRETQERIGAILYAYDDLIENNTRRIAVLEEMARRIFEEWFVHFRAPGCEGLPMVDSAVGPIPKGWEVKRLGDLLDLRYGRALKADQRQDGPFPVYGSSGVVGTHSSFLVKGPGIIVGRKGNVGSVHWSEQSFYPIDTVFFVDTALPLPFVYHLLLRQRFLNSDAAVPGLNRSQALAIQVVQPSDKLLGLYAQIAEPIFKLRQTLVSQSANLGAQRDLLLPKLISGEIDVSRSAATLPEAAE